MSGFIPVDGRNPAPVDRWFIYKVLYIPGGAGFLPSTVSQFSRCWFQIFVIFIPT